jgi:hypothetical protein
VSFPSLSSSNNCAKHHKKGDREKEEVEMVVDPWHDESSECFVKCTTQKKIIAKIIAKIMNFMCFIN